ncbi:uncharacterized protein LOC142830467 [Pelodiscus sinensis]|uniref:uncharacterized protein LOC142830467 n=1 Tax=Pelodiscus sinensis TaxID=13735 RepID=UPI003F6B6934
MKPVTIDMDFSCIEKEFAREGWGNPKWDKEMLEKDWGQSKEIWQEFCNWRTACKMRKGKGKSACIWLLKGALQAACTGYWNLETELIRVQKEKDELQKQCQNLDTRVRTLTKDNEHLQGRLLPMLEKEGIERREKLETKPRSINRAKVETALWLDPDDWDGDIWNSDNDDLASHSPDKRVEVPPAQMRPVITYRISGNEKSDSDEDGPSQRGRRTRGRATRRTEERKKSSTQVTTRSYRPTELREIQEDFAKKPQEGIIDWLIRIWDTGAGLTPLSALECSRLNLGAGVFLSLPEDESPKTLWTLACRWAARIHRADRGEPTISPWTNIDEVKRALQIAATITLLNQVNPRLEGEEGSPWEQAIQLDELRPLMKGAPGAHKAISLKLRDIAQNHPEDNYESLLTAMVRYFREFGGNESPPAKAKVRNLRRNPQGKSEGSKPKREITPEEKELRNKLWKQCLALGYPRDIIHGLPTERLKLLATFRKANKEKEDVISSAPPRTVHPHITAPGITNLGSFLHRYKRKFTINPLVRRPTGFHRFTRAFLPWLGVAELEQAIVNVSGQLEIAFNQTADALGLLNEQIQSVARFALQNRIALDAILAQQGGVCAVINQSCCFYVNHSGQIEQDVSAIKDAVKILHAVAKDGEISWLNWLAQHLGLSLTPFLHSILITVLTIVIVIIIFCITLCIVKCLVNVAISSVHIRYAALGKDPSQFLDYEPLNQTIGHF